MILENGRVEFWYTISLVNDSSNWKTLIIERRNDGLSKWDGEGIKLVAVASMHDACQNSHTSSSI